MLLSPSVRWLLLYCAALGLALYLIARYENQRGEDFSVDIRSTATSTKEEALAAWLNEGWVDDPEDLEDKASTAADRRRRRAKRRPDQSGPRNVTGSESARQQRARRNTTVILSSKQRKVQQMTRLKPTDASLGRLRDVVEAIESDVIILSAATFTYQELAFNWIRHLEDLGITNYGVLCFDETVYRYIGSAHGFLMANAASNYSDSDGSASAAYKAKKAAADKDKRARRPGQVPLAVLEERARAKRSRAPERAPFAPREHRRLSRLQNLVPYSMQPAPASGSSRSSKAERRPGEPKEMKMKNKKEQEEEEEEEGKEKEGKKEGEEVLARRRDKMLERRGKTSKIRATSMHFTSYQMAKFDAIHTILAMNKTVVWSDSDAVWIDACAYKALVGMPPEVDVAGQRALFPTTLSLVTGVCLCSGFFMLRPSAPSLALVQSVRSMLLENEDDQSALNKALLSLGAFHYGFEAVRGETAQLVRRRRKGVYNSTAILHTSPKPAPKAPLKPPPKAPGSPKTQPVVVSIHLALLPYHLFPRGQVAVPITQGMTREEKTEYKSKKRINNTTATEPQQWPNASLAEGSPALPHEQAAEWRQFARGACLWHMVSAKEGRTKVATMRRDGVFKLAAAGGWRFENANYTVQDVHQYLYDDRL